MTSDIDFQQACLRIAELRGQNEWFTDADAALTLRLIELIPASTNSPDRVVERGPRRIAVRTRKSSSSYRMRSGGYDKLAQRWPGLYRAVVSRKLAGEPKTTLMLSGPDWRAHSDAVKASVPVLDTASYIDPWKAAEDLRAFRDAKRANGIEMDELRAKAVVGVPLGVVWKGTPTAVKVYETSTTGSRQCDFEELRRLAPDVFAALVDEKPGTATEWIDLRHLHRTPGDVDLYEDDAPDSAAASLSGMSSAVDETYFRE